MPSGMASTTRVPTRFSTASTQWPTSSNTSGIRVWHSLRPDARVNHTSDESEGAPMSVIKPALDPKTVYLEVSNRDPADGAHYSDVDLRWNPPHAPGSFTRRDGTPY